MANLIIQCSVTNGTQFNERNIKHIESNNVKVQISLDGANADSHDKIRGEGSFSKLLKGVSLLRKSQVRYIFHSVVTKYNYLEINKLKDLTKKLGAEEIRFSPLQDKGRAKETYSVIRPRLSNLNEMSEEINNIRNTSCSLFNDKREITISPKISPNGSFYMCQIFDNIEFILGNVNNEKINDILHGTKIGRVYDLFKLRPYFLTECEKCVWKSVCGRGCPAVNSFFETDGLCEARKLYFSSLLPRTIHNLSE